MKVFARYAAWCPGLAQQSSNPDQWLVHQIDTVHWFIGLPHPRSVVTNGGIYLRKDGRQNWDTLTAVFDHGPLDDLIKGFQVQYTSRFTNSAGGVKELYYSTGGKITGENQPILDQNSRYIFSRRNHARTIDHVITLKALDRVVFNDAKEGLLGMRVAHWHESPDEKVGIFMDADGRPTKVDAADATDATGLYLTSGGTKRTAVWWTRGRWCSLSGHAGEHRATITIFDNPNSSGYPTGTREDMDCSRPTRLGVASSIQSGLHSTSSSRKSDDGFPFPLNCVFAGGKCG